MDRRALADFDIFPHGVRDEMSADQPPKRPASNLPTRLTSFVGRETEVAQIDALAREHRLVTLTGPGGIGKTRTALQVGAGLSDTTRGGVWLAELSALTDGWRGARARAPPLG